MREHPYGVVPLGNALTTQHATPSHTRRRALGQLSVLPDALLVRILETLVSTTPARRAAAALCALSAASTYTRAFAADEDLWRRLAHSTLPPSSLATAASAASWRAAFLNAAAATPPPPTRAAASPVYSDVLFHKWRCLTTPISPSWLARDNARRVSLADTPPAHFRSTYEEPGIPVVITGALESWPAAKSWSAASLSSRFGETKFHAGGFEFDLRDYLAYCAAIAAREDQPLYIFDRSFAEKAPPLAEEYEVPPYFRDDLFHVLGAARRPDYRWLIIGPARSGSSFHKDPNATSAWNAVVRGEKKWVLFPPDCTPPGVHPSGDEGDVTAPVSITEWFLNFYDPDVLDRCGAVECTVREGEVMFVPMGWWHCVLNTKTSIAITQNYVSPVNVGSVIAWLRDRPSQVSGCRSKEQAKFICENFARLVAETCPELRTKLGNFETHRQRDVVDECDVRRRKKRKPSLWDTLQSPSSREQWAPGRDRANQNEARESEPVSFSFGF